MSIERSLDLLGARKAVKPGEVSKPERKVQTTGSAKFGKSRGLDDLRKNNLLMRSEGEANLETGNDFHRMPQTMMELRSVGETAFNHGNKSGNVAIDISLAGLQRLNLTGNTTLSFSLGAWATPAYDGQTRVNGVVLWISKGAGALNINVDHWAGFAEDPDFSAAGFYVVAIDIADFGDLVESVGYTRIPPVA